MFLESDKKMVGLVWLYGLWNKIKESFLYKTKEKENVFLISNNCIFIQQNVQNKVWKLLKGVEENVFVFF